MWQRNSLELLPWRPTLVAGGLHAAHRAVEVPSAPQREPS